MRNVILVAFTLIFNFSLYSQKKSTIDTLKLATFKIEELGQYKNKTTVGTIILEDNTVITKGSKFIMGMPSNPMNINNNVYNGVKVANTSIDFTYIYSDKYSILGAMGSSVGLPSTWKGTEILVDEIFMFKAYGNTFGLLVNFTKSDGGNVAIGKYGNIRSLLDALKSGELVNPNRGLTREEAIAKLKEAKDLLDLGIIKQEDFDKLKAKLTPKIIE
jgi:hypothetical protein